MDAATADRLAANEARFREVNDRLRGDVGELVEPMERVPFVCECSRPDCRETIELALPEYAGVRADALCFALVPGHDVPEIEDVVQREERYVVVRKRQGRDVARSAR
jgi:hypothetical protein